MLTDQIGSLNLVKDQNGWEDRTVTKTFEVNLLPTMNRMESVACLVVAEVPRLAGYGYERLSRVVAYFWAFWVYTNSSIAYQDNLIISYSRPEMSFRSCSVMIDCNCIICSGLNEVIQLRHKLEIIFLSEGFAMLECTLIDLLNQNTANFAFASPITALDSSTQLENRLILQPRKDYRVSHAEHLQQSILNQSEV